MKPHIKPIIITEPITASSIVNFKKFFGLEKLMNMTTCDYIICCDAEIDIIPLNFNKENMNKKITQIFENKKIYSGYIKDCWVSKVTESAARHFPESYEMLKELTHNFKVYSWWSDLPVCRMSDLADLFKIVKDNNITFFEFEYIIYQHFLIIKDSFRIINTTPLTKIYWSFEGLNTTDTRILDALVEEGYGYGWVTKTLYMKIPSYLIEKGTFIVYHLDRNVEAYNI